jgi:hypothetical protein
MGPCVSEFSDCPPARLARVEQKGYKGRVAGALETGVPQTQEATTARRTRRLVLVPASRRAARARRRLRR